MWCRLGLRANRNLRKFCTAARQCLKDEGDWFYSSEWWEPESDGHTVFRATSDKGNGDVSVVAHPSSRPSRDQWGGAEKWLEQRYMDIQPGEKRDGRFKVLGYQWRSLRFNYDTRQSTVKVMAACNESEPGSLFLMQQPHCLAVPYLKSMATVGLVSLASCGYDLKNAASGKNPLRILCIGHGGGSLPLFLASKIPGAVVDIVEIDPVVISASVQAMGFPAFSVITASGARALPSPDTTEQILWRDIHERLNLYEADAENFIVRDQNLYDLVFIDAYDGGDIFPQKLWDPNSVFLKALSDRLHQEHGTVVVNLHSSSDIFEQTTVLPGGKYVAKVGRAYKTALLGDKNNGSVFACAVPWLCNTSLVACRGLRSEDESSGNRNVVLNRLVSKSMEVEHVLDFPFSCLEYLRAGLAFLD